MNISYKFKLFGVSILSLLFLLVGNVKNAEAATETCIWIGMQDIDMYMSTAINWQKEGGGACTEIGTGDTLKFTGTAPGVVDDAEWDPGLNEMVAAVIIDSNYTGTIQVNSGATVVVTGNIAVNGGNFIFSNAGNQAQIGSLNIGAGGILTNNGLVTTADSSGIKIAGVVDNAGTISDSGAIDMMSAFTNSGTYTKSTTGTLILRSDFTNSGTFNDSAGTIISSSTSAGFGGVGNTILYNLSVSSTLTLTGNVTTTNVLTINTGHSLDAATYIINLTKNIGIPFVKNGTFTSSTSTVNYAGAISATIASTTYYNIIINTAGTLTGNVTTTNNLVINAGKSLSSSSSILNVGGNLDNSGTTTFLILRMNGSNATLGGSGITSLTSLSIVGDVTTLVGNVTSTSVCVVQPGKTFNLSTYNFVVSTGIAVGFNSVITQTSGTFTMNGSGNIDNSGGYIQFAAMNLSGTVSLSGDTSVTSTATTTISGTLNGNEGQSLILAGSGTPLVISGTFNANTSTVKYSGTGQVIVAPMTYYNLEIDSENANIVDGLTVQNVLTINAGKTLNHSNNSIVLTGTGTPFVINGTFVESFGFIYYNGVNSTIASTTYYGLVINEDAVSAGDIIVSTSLLGVSSGKTLTMNGNLSTQNVDGAGSIVAYNSSTLRLAGGSVVLSSFTANSSTVILSGGGVVPSATFYNLELGSGTYSINDNVTTTNDFINGGDLTIASGKNLSVAGIFDNNGDIVENGAIIHGRESVKLTDISRIEKNTYSVGSDSVYVTVEDSDGNLNFGEHDNISGVIVTENTRSDSETITLFETGIDTGIFRSEAIALSVASVALVNNGIFGVAGNGTLNLVYVDSKDATDTDSDEATFTYSAPPSGGGGGGGSSQVLITPTVVSALTAIQIKGNLTQTASPKVTLLLNATNAMLMALSNTANFTGASWEAYNTTKEWLLSPNNGEKNIYVKFRSSSGGETSVYSTKITLKNDGLGVKEIVNVDNNLNNNIFTEELSDLSVTGINNFVYAPYAKIKFTYAYKNSNPKTTRVKIIRQLLNTKGKVIRTSSAIASLKSNAVFKRNVAEWTPGPVSDYTVKIRILDMKNKLIEEKMFKYSVVKPIKIKK